MRIGPLGIWELLIILVVVLLIFGPRRLPEMAKGLGQSVREFRKGIKDIKGDFEEGESGGASAGKRASAAPASEATASSLSVSVPTPEPKADTAESSVEEAPEQDTTKQKVASEA